MVAYYSEFEPKAAAWLRELIKQGHIADGEVDERDLWDVAPDDLRGFKQWHFCAGIGVWSYALRRAGWPDDREVLTASFPCQPFSAAGKGLGFADERHLWPAGLHLIRELQPAVVFGEQVSSKDGLAWFDLVQADMEGEGYACGALDTCAAGVGAPHIRQRLYWVADALSAGRTEGRPLTGDRSFTRSGGPSELADDDDDAGLEGRRQPGRERAAERPAGAAPAGAGGVVGGLEQPGGERWERRQETAPRHDLDGPASERAQGQHGSGLAGAFGVHQDGTGPTNGLWRDADWLLCRDGKWRPVEPGAFPLAHGAPARVGRLRGYGNAVNSQAAQAWIEAYLDAESRGNAELEEMLG